MAQTAQHFETIQKRLIVLKLYDGKIDGLMGPKTRLAIERFQKDHKLEIDGVVGPATWAELFPKIVVPPTAVHTPIANMASAKVYLGTAIRLTSKDFEKVAGLITVPTVNLMAVTKVESAGSGFDAKGRVLPLYEPHIAWKYAGGKRTALSRENLAYQKWGSSPYPKTMDGRFAQIDRAASIADWELACDSTSWGLPQMMGFNASSCGYNDAVTMVSAFAQGEYYQLLAMATFIRNNTVMWHALKNSNWPKFAENYNGASYRKNDYDNRLANAVTFFKKKGF